MNRTPKIGDWIEVCRDSSLIIDQVDLIVEEPGETPGFQSKKFYTRHNGWYYAKAVLRIVDPNIVNQCVDCGAPEHGRTVSKNGGPERKICMSCVKERDEEMNELEFFRQNFGSLVPFVEDLKVPSSDDPLWVLAHGSKGLGLIVLSWRLDSGEIELESHARAFHKLPNIPDGVGVFVFSGRPEGSGFAGTWRRPSILELADYLSQRQDDDVPAHAE